MFEKMKQRKMEKEKEEAKRIKTVQIENYKKSLPRLYNHLSEQQLIEAKDCINSIIQTGNTYGNPSSSRLIQIVNNFWLDPVSGSNVSQPHDLSYFKYDLDYINSILKQK